jgi:hypothetical protein
VEQEQELVLLREENVRLKSVSEADRRRIKDLEDRLVNAESANNSLQRQVHASKQAKVVLENEVSCGGIEAEFFFLIREIFGGNFL